MEPETKHQSDTAMNNSTIKKTEIQDTTASKPNWESRIGGKQSHEVTVEASESKGLLSWTTEDGQGFK